MSQKTYALLANDGDKRLPYSPLVFQTRGLLNKFRLFDKDHDVAFSTAQELADSMHLHDLEGLYTTLAVTFGEKAVSAKELSHLELAKAIYSWTSKRAKAPSEGTRTMDHEATPTTQATPEKASAKPAKAPKEAAKPAKGHKVYANEQTITRLLPAPPIAAGSNRHRNMATVMASKTVGEALTALRALTPRGVPADIDLAVEKGAVEIK